MMKLFAALVALAAAGVGVAMVVGGRVPVGDNRTIVPLTVASPADSFVVHDAAPPPVPATPAPAAPDASTPSALDAAIARLRATAPSAAPDTPAVPPAVTPAPDTSLAGSTSAPIIQAAPLTPQPTPTTPPITPPEAPLAPPPPPPPAWTAVTSQGARWRSGRDTLVIDMGGGRTATVRVEPAFQALSQEAANARVDFLKQTILETFPPGSTQFRFARDGSVSMLR